MSLSFYSPTIKDRVNPEFVGIAKKFSASKGKRQNIQDKRDTLFRTLKYKMSVNESLDKNLEEQRSRLKEVKSVYERRVADGQFKQEQAERKKNKLRSLSTSVKQKREEMKRSVKDALFEVFSRNRNSREKERQLHEFFDSKVQEREEYEAAQNYQKFKMIKGLEKHSRNMVNRFYKNANKESLYNYKNWITEETEKAEAFSEQIKVMETEISKYDVQIENKKDKIYSIFSEIQVFTAQPSECQSRFLPACLRATSQSLTRSTHPKDFLLKGPRSVFQKTELSEKH